MVYLACGWNNHYVILELSSPTEDDLPSFDMLEQL